MIPDRRITIDHRGPGPYGETLRLDGCRKVIDMSIALGGRPLLIKTSDSEHHDLCHERHLWKEEA
jgi:hypothetical protein